MADGRRLLYDGPQVVAFVPAAARYPYEVWIATRHAVPVARRSRRGRARRFRAGAQDRAAQVRRRCGIVPFPTSWRFIRRRPTASRTPKRICTWSSIRRIGMPDRLKYLAGSELGAGVFTADTDPDDTAAELRAARVQVD